MQMHLKVNMPERDRNLETCLLRVEVEVGVASLPLWLEGVGAAAGVLSCLQFQEVVAVAVVAAASFQWQGP